MNWYLAVLKKYAVFEGRARRMEYWMFTLFNIIIIFVLGIVGRVVGLGGESGMNVLGSLYSLGILVPAIAVGVRRLHDTGRSGLWMLIIFLPVLGALIFLVLMVLDSQPESNQYGPNPK